jgi:hypothetical protein
MRKLTQEEFVNKSILVHHNYYDYSLVKYIVNCNKVKIICPIHGEFLQTPNAHLLGKGCKKCSIKFSLDEFIELANKVHNYKYDYSKTNYIDSTKKIIIICPDHGEFSQRTNQHMFGHGCPKCAYVVSKPESMWLDRLSIPEEYRQKSLRVNMKNLRVDAYDPITNTIYEFYGDYWHGNPKVFDQNKIHPEMKKTYGEIYQRTINREVMLKAAGYNIVSIWEADYNES